MYLQMKLHDVRVGCGGQASYHYALDWRSGLVAFLYYEHIDVDTTRANLLWRISYMGGIEFVIQIEIDHVGSTRPADKETTSCLRLSGGEAYCKLR